MNSGIIARRYGSALWMFAVKHAAQERVYLDTCALSRAYMDYSALRRVLSNRLVSADEKIGVVSAICGGNMSSEFGDFLKLVLSSSREDYLQTMCLCYGTIYLREQKILGVQITTATLMDEELKEAFIDKLALLTGKNITLNCVVDPKIMGGFVARWETYRLDSSVTTKLKMIKNAITAGATVF